MDIACYICSDAVFNQVQVPLASAGFGCERFLSENLLLRMIHRRNFQLILVEVGNNEIATESILSWLTCRSGETTPVVLLSGAHCAELAAQALDAGADDFIAVPCEPVEFIARIHARIRRTKGQIVRRSIEIAGFTLDREANTFYDRGTPVELTPREFTMAWLFFSTPGIYISREAIGSAIWGADSEVAGRTIEQHVYKLRKKLHLSTERGVIIRTAYTHGYRLESFEAQNQP